MTNSAFTAWDTDNEYRRRGSIDQLDDALANLYYKFYVPSTDHYSTATKTVKANTPCIEFPTATEADAYWGLVPPEYWYGGHLRLTYYYFTDDTGHAVGTDVQLEYSVSTKPLSTQTNPGSNQSVITTATSNETIAATSGALWLVTFVVETTTRKDLTVGTMLNGHFARNGTAGADDWDLGIWYAGVKVELFPLTQGG